MKYKVFISDFDGTMGHVPDIVHPDTVRAIKNYCEKGGNFVIITGRSLSSTKAICEKYGFNCVVAPFQGSSVVDLRNGKTLYDSGLSISRAKEMLTDIKQFKIGISCWSNDTLFYEQENGYTDLYSKSMSIKTVTQIEDFAKLEQYTVGPVSKINLIAEADKVDEYVDFFQKRYGEDVIVNSGAKYLIEIIDAKYNKGYAVRKIAEFFGVHLNEVIAVGDSTNDLKLLDGEWHGVAVGDAKEQLKAIAKEITVPYSMNPIKVLLEKYG